MNFINVGMQRFWEFCLPRMRVHISHLLSIEKLKSESSWLRVKNPGRNIRSESHIGMPLPVVWNELGLTRSHKG
jgi:hypothetical protein